MRTKKGVENSFNRPDSINAIDWNWKTTHKRLVENYRTLIDIRKSHWIFHMTEATQIRDALEFLPTGPRIVAYRLDGETTDDPWKTIVVVANANTTGTTITLPPGNWKLGYSSAQRMPASAKGTLKLEPLSFSLYHE